MAICRANGERNGVGAVEYRQADWTEWDDQGSYEWILGSDILYGEAQHPGEPHVPIEERQVLQRQRKRSAGRSERRGEMTDEPGQADAIDPEAREEA